MNGYGWPMRLRLAAGSAALFALVVSIAVAQSVPIKLAVDARVTPDKAGTPKRPQGVHVDVTARVAYPSDYDPPVVATVDVWFPRGGLYNGQKFPSCAQDTLSRRGPRACPAGSIMGSGLVTASADGVPTFPKITVVNGGGSRVYFYTVLNNPARVQAPVPGVITRLGGRWSYKLRVTIPRQLQIVAGIPIKVSKLRMTAGRGDWLATTSCPRSRRWSYKTEVRFTTGALVRYSGSIGCR